MSTIDEKTSIDELTGNTGEPPTPGHDAWFRQKVEASLAKAKSGQMTYRSLDEVAAEFGFDAR